MSLFLDSNSKTASLIGSKIKDLDLPEGSLIALIHRKGEILIPKGRTILEELDRLTILSSPKGIQYLYDTYIRKNENPIKID